MELRPGRYLAREHCGDMNVREEKLAGIDDTHTPSLLTFSHIPPDPLISFRFGPIHMVCH